MLPCQVRVVSAGHPLSGKLLQANGFKHWDRRLVLVVVLPDGTPGTVAVDATDVFGRATAPQPAAVLSVEGLRHLKELVSSMKAAGGSTCSPKTRK